MSLAGWESAPVKIPFTIPDQGELLTDFVVVLKISASSGASATDLTRVFDEVGSNWQKIAVELRNTGTQCYVELETWDSVATVGVLRVKIPACGDGDTTHYLYADNTQTDNTAYVGAVGSTAGQNVVAPGDVGVYRQSTVPSGTGSVLDSSSYGNNGTSYNMGTSNLVDGLIGNGWDYNGTNEYCAINGVCSDISGGDLDVSFLFKMPANPGVEAIYSMHGSSGNANRLLCWAPAQNRVQLILLNLSGSQILSLYTSYFLDNNYHTVQFSYTRSTNAVVLFVDGVLAASGTTSATWDIESNGRASIGQEYDTGPGDYADMILDELVVSATPKSAAWRLAWHLSVTDGLIAFGRINQEKSIALFITSVVEQYKSIDLPIANALEQTGQFRIALSRRAERALNLLIDISTLYERALRLPITGYIGREAFQQLRISGALAQLEQYKEFTIEDFDRVYCEAFQRFSIYAGLAGLVKETGIALSINGSPVPFETGAGGDSEGVYFKAYEFTTDYSDLIKSLPDPTKSRPSAQIAWASEIKTEGGSQIVFNWVIELILDSITVSRVTDQGTKHTSETATIRLVSPTAALGWLDGNLGAAPITASWSSGTMATTILDDIFPDSLTYDLQLDDFPIGQQLDVKDLYPNEIIPLFCIECVIHTANDGTLIIRNRPDVRGTVIPVHDLSPSDYEMSAVDSDDQGQYRPNVIRVANYQEADSSQSLQAPEIVADENDSRKALVYAYPVPVRQVWLRSSHIPHTEYTQTEGFTETIETTEQVEFLDGQASTSRPVTGGFDSIDYGSNANLGTVTPNEDGTLTATIKSRSLATVTYSTKRYRFQIADYDEHDLQLWFVDEEDL